MGLLDNRNLGKIKVLLWKNYLARRYFWVTTLIEAVVPILIAAYVTWVISKHSKHDFTVHPATYEPVIDRQSVLLNIVPVNCLVYTPQCSFTQKMMELVKNDVEIIASISMPYNVNLIPKATEDELESYILNLTFIGIAMGIVFNGLNETSCQTVPDFFHIELRPSGLIDASSLYPPTDKAGPNPTKDVYMDSGVAAFQLLMNEHYIEMKNKNWKRPDVEFQAFPYPEYESSPVPRDTLSFVICFSIIITFVALTVPFINHVTEEKGNGTKELIMLHGVKEWMIWFSWFIYAITVFVVSLTIMALILKLPMSGKGTEPIRFVPFPILWLMLILYCIATMSFSFMFCAIFHQGALAALAYLAVSVLEIIIDLTLQSLDIYSFSMLFCLLPTTAFSKGFDMIRVFEEIGVQHPWKSIVTRIEHQNPVSILTALVMLVIDIILYTSLTYYISVINPGQYGIKRSPFYFLESYIPFLRPGYNEEPVSIDTDWEENYEFIEPPAPDEESSIQIKDLYKEYGSFYAVQGIEMEMYENEITVLLGHNGAGKTTLLGILAGLILPDAGSITYKDMDVLENQDEFRETLGVSFQEDRLFPYLSVMNHLLFYGMLKGYSRSEVTEEAETYLERMEMYEERHSWMKNITEGMKRKLSFMISLMGDSKTLLLDQPTFGMDMQSKVMTWDFLMDIRQGRTIISTARDMHDAEKIADRIAIMESGVLVSYGTVAFLKRTFGAAYELSISTENGNNSNITSFVNSYIPNSIVRYETDNEILFKIQASETPRFPEFFQDLENYRDELGITGIELGYTKLEQILLEIGSLSKSASTGAENIDIISESQYVDVKEGTELTMLQLKTLFKKKFMYTKRTYLYTLARIFLPVLMALLAVKVIEFYDLSMASHDDLSLSLYPGSLVMFSKHEKSEQYESYYSYIKEEGASIIEAANENIVEELIECGSNRIIFYRKNLIAGFEVGKPHRIFYNQWILHSLPVAITTYYNSLVRNGTNIKDIQVKNHPIPTLENAHFVKRFVRQKRIIMLVLFSVFSFFIADVLLYFFEFTNMEITRSLLHIQIISKVPVGIYWFAIFVYDFVFFVIIVAIRIAAFKLFDDVFQFFTFGPPFGIFLGIILFFGVGGLLFVYVLSFFLHPSKETIVKLVVFNFLCSITVVLYMHYANGILEFFGKFKIIVYIIEAILSLIPFFNYNLLIIKFLEIWYNNTSCYLWARSLIQQCLDTYPKVAYLEFASEENPHGLMLGCIFLIADIVLYFILLYLISSKFLSYIYNMFNASKERSEGYSQINDDVRQELDEIQNLKESESSFDEVPLLVDGLRKLHMKSFQPYVAVNDVSFIAENGMCFGLLGVDGAGKSTTLKMLSTEVLPSSGDALIEGTSLSSDEKQYISRIGYCPQSNPLMDELTGREMLTMIASLRGISGYEAEMLADQWISFLKLEKYQNRNCGSYSNGSKRKLCTAISLIGNPKVVFLDEPTTDLDPVSTRRLHDIIRKCKEAGLIMVLASPNIEECEILCDRIIILVRGEMFCIGTLKDLQKQYSRGYTVTFKIHYDATSLDETFNLEENMIKTFNPRYCELIEEQRGLLRYHINDPSISLSTLFAILQTVKYNNPIVDEYIATNTTLGDVFIALSQSEFEANASSLFT